MAQALVRWMAAQRVERDGVERPFFAGVWGIFGHGNVAGIGQALHQEASLRYVLSRNEQAQVHAAAGYARMTNRLQTWACTSSIGPGATNMLTGAAGATINRLPVLLLPGDTFASRRPDPVLQQLEVPGAPGVTVNDAFRSVSRYWDRLTRPEQLVAAAPAAMRVLTDQADTGAVTLALPQDVQTEAFDYPARLFEKRVWRIERPRPDRAALAEAVARVRGARQPLIVAGGGVIYAEATDALARLVEATGIPVAETMAGKGALPWDHPSALGAIGVTGTPGANRIAREADLVLGVGTRWTDFTTASKTAFQNPDVRFVNVNVARFDAFKMAGLPLVADARAALEELAGALEGWSVEDDYREQVRRHAREWDEEVARIHALGHAPLPSQGEVIGAVNRAAGPRDVVVAAAGSLPGDLHKLWRCRDPKAYHVEYGYSCMGYEVAGGLGVKMAAPDREVFVMVGDGSWLMMSSEVVTSLQEGVRLIVVLIDNHGFASIGGLSEAVGSGGFGTRYRRRREGEIDLAGEILRVDFAANAESLGARAVRARTITDLEAALAEAREADRTTVLTIETDPSVAVGSFESWWDVAVAEVSEQEPVRDARARYEEEHRKEGWFV
ncbi:MAG TPA: 3D-(3,5/4)-trihydroxycyclohexane-1,2-dione acylhydrolase (decyclizing) [Gemmatimonadota bacterium]|nr:3D-(3,5/4)-trihydroxycyclohexane-1,2-dione acylhydrolase (decyclizing) [Gemmatimonadota bacterium]